MNQQQWDSVEAYICGQLVPQDAVLSSTLASIEAAGMPAISVAPPEGRLLMLLASLLGARRILEVGTLGGYSTICLARALPPDGQLVSLELEAHHAQVAAANVAAAGLSNLVEIRTGPALDSLAALAAEGAGPFDLVFIDADKPNNPGYFRWALQLSRPGSLIVVDNVIRHGEISNAASEDPRVQGTREMFELVAAEPRVRATAIQSVGSKGYDGMAFIQVL